MAWITPKTDWVETDFINTSDYNRIAGNLNYIEELANVLYTVQDTEELSDDKVYSDLPFTDLYNAVENNLEKINQYTYAFDIGDTKTFVVNQPYIDYVELNRIESWTLRIKLTLEAQKENKPRLAFTLGNYREIKL